MLRICLRRFADIKKVFENEFYTNPHFDKAFPHLSSKLGDGPSEPPPQTWGESLQYKRKDNPLSNIEVLHEHENLYYEGYRTPAGPLKWLSQEDKDRIHAQIDFKMDELETTGLSREEILLNRPGGLPLSMDPVFQFLRHNRSAREMLVKPGEEFTAQKVVDYSLRQDIGVDRAKTHPDIGHKFEHELALTYDYDVLVGNEFPRKISPEAYYWQEKFEEKKRNLDELASATPLVFPHKIATKRKRLRKNQRIISLKDIHFKNTEFLSQFMTDGARIKSRWQTRLTGRTQRKVSKAIKHARQLNLFPNRGFILPPHKKNLVPLHTQTFQSLVIHAETGAVFPKKFEGEVSRFNEFEYHNTVEKEAQKFLIKNNEENYEENIKVAQGLIDYDIQWMPTKKEIEILQAHQFLIKGTGEGKETAERLAEASKFHLAADIGTNFVHEKAADPRIVMNM